MDVLLTASCCCLVPTPVNSHVRAHNLLQVFRLIELEMLAVIDLFLMSQCISWGKMWGRGFGVGNWLYLYLS